LQAVSTIGLDIAKSAFQVHGIDAEGKVLIRHQLKRRYVLAFFAPTVRMMKALRRFWPLLSRSCDPIAVARLPPPSEVTIYTGRALLTPEEMPGTLTLGSQFQQRPDCREMPLRPCRSPLVNLDACVSWSLVPSLFQLVCCTSDTAARHRQE
jgi:hypothetical protein